MSTRTQVLARLSELKPRLRAKYQVESLALFGSCAREENLPDSDIDILVDVPGSIGLGFIDLADELERELDHKVDLVSARGLKPSIKQAIESDLIHA
jgi:predicted nucleotidyltransferase